MTGARSRLALAWAVPAAVLLGLALWQGERAGSGATVVLSWKASPDAAFYHVYRSSISGSAYRRIGSVAGLSFRDTPVARGTAFYYVVTAAGRGRESSYSNEIKVVVP